MTFYPKSERHIQFEQPCLASASEIYQLIQKSPPLDLNSEYLYLLLCKHFKETCVLAYENKALIGLTTAFFVPNQKNTLFIWQIAVSKEARKIGLAKRMLLHLLQRSHCSNVHFLELTINPSNQASQKLFHSFAKEVDADITETVGFGSELFLNSKHEQENLLRIGPINREVLKNENN